MRTMADLERDGERLDAMISAMLNVTPGEWYVWEDSENNTAQLLSRTHGEVLPKMSSHREHVWNLNAIARVANRLRGF